MEEGKDAGGAGHPAQQRRRAVFGGMDDKPLQHLGEAETCYVIEHWPEFTGSWWFSDDQEALRFARFRGITTRETIDLVSMSCCGSAARSTT